MSSGASPFRQHSGPPEGWGNPETPTTLIPPQHAQVEEVKEDESVELTAAMRLWAASIVTSVLHGLCAFFLLYHVGRALMEMSTVLKGAQFGESYFTPQFFNGAVGTSSVVATAFTGVLALSHFYLAVRMPLSKDGGRSTLWWRVGLIVFATGLALLFPLIVSPITLAVSTIP